MAQNPIKIGSFTATTAAAVSITPVGNPGIGGLGGNLWVEVTAISAGSAVTTSGASFRWSSPGGNAITIGASSAALITSTTNSQMLTLPPPSWIPPNAPVPCLTKCSLPSRPPPPQTASRVICT